MTLKNFKKMPSIRSVGSLEHLALISKLGPLAVFQLAAKTIKTTTTTTTL